MTLIIQKMLNMPIRRQIQAKPRPPLLTYQGAEMVGAGTPTPLLIKAYCHQLCRGQPGNDYSNDRPVYPLNSQCNLGELSCRHTRTPTKWDVNLLMQCGECLKTTHALLGFVTYITDPHTTDSYEEGAEWVLLNRDGNLWGMALSEKSSSDRTMIWRPVSVRVGLPGSQMLWVGT